MSKVSIETKLSMLKSGGTLIKVKHIDSGIFIEAKCMDCDVESAVEEIKEELIETLTKVSSLKDTFPGVFKNETIH